MCGCYIFVIIILQFCGSYKGFKISNFKDFCGDTIYDDAGELRFDAQELPSYLTGSNCSVTVQPQSDVITEKTRVLFYFTKFDLTEPCEYMNVKVEDGPLYNRTRVEGLPEYVCGHNTSLERDDQIFTTRTDQFTITFSRKDFAKYSAGNFTIKFIPFKLGECKGSDVSNCSNGRCVESKYYCSDEINACGERQIECDILEQLKKILEVVSQIFEKYGWIIPVLIGLCVLKCCYKKHRKTICNLKSSAWSGLRKLFSSCCQLKQRTDTRRRSSDGSFRLRVNFPTPRESPRGILIASNQSNSSPRIARPEVISLNGDLHSESSDEDNLTHLDMQQNLPSAPPPSYDEVVAPSYEDVVANKDKYII